MPTPFKPDTNKPLALPAEGNWPEAKHCFTEIMVNAIEAAIYANRPLLIRGEPGTGKSQLARAAAQHMQRLFLSHVVNAHTEAEDLQWHFDALGRLGNAQVGFIPDDSVDSDDHKRKEAERKKNFLKPEYYLSPGPLWWTFDFGSAESQFDKAEYKKAVAPTRPMFNGKVWQPEQGCVLLIDEIDKAEPELPNGLLETLGNGAFTVPYCEQASIKMNANGDNKPLVIFTTNEERQLPNAFIRRCLVLQLTFPKDVEGLIKIGRAHFEEACGTKVYTTIAESILKDRHDKHDASAPKPGVAEYIDILRILTGLSRDEAEQLAAFERVKTFALNKTLLTD